MTTAIFAATAAADFLEKGMQSIGFLRKSNTYKDMDNMRKQGYNFGLSKQQEVAYGSPLWGQFAENITNMFEKLGYKTRNGINDIKDKVRRTQRFVEENSMPYNDGSINGGYKTNGNY